MHLLHFTDMSSSEVLSVKTTDERDRTTTFRDSGSQRGKVWSACDHYIILTIFVGWSPKHKEKLLTFFDGHGHITFPLQ